MRHERGPSIDWRGPTKGGAQAAPRRERGGPRRRRAPRESGAPITRQVARSMAFAPGHVLTIRDVRSGRRPPGTARRAWTPVVLAAGEALGRGRGAAWAATAVRRSIREAPRRAERK